MFMGLHCNLVFGERALTGVRTASPSSTSSMIVAIAICALTKKLLWSSSMATTFSLPRRTWESE